MTLLVGLPAVHNHIPFQRPSYSNLSFLDGQVPIAPLNLHKKVLRRIVLPRFSGLDKKNPRSQSVCERLFLPDQTQIVPGGGIRHIFNP